MRVDRLCPGVHTGRGTGRKARSGLCTRLQMGGGEGGAHAEGGRRDGEITCQVSHAHTHICAHAHAHIHGISWQIGEGSMREFATLFP